MEHFARRLCLFYDLMSGGILTAFTFQTIRWVVYIGLSLFGMTYELLYSEAVRWPLLGGYALVIGLVVYSFARRAHHPIEGEEQAAD